MVFCRVADHSFPVLPLWIRDDDIQVRYHILSRGENRVHMDPSPPPRMRANVHNN